MDSFHLEILSPEREFYNGDCLSLTLPISDGMIGIMAHHSPLTAAIPDGELGFRIPSGEQITCAVTRGMVDVGDNRVVVLCESALYPDEIDEQAERRAADEAERQLKAMQSEKDYKLWQLSFNQAVNRLKIKKKKNINL